MCTIENLTCMYLYYNVVNKNSCEKFNFNPTYTYFEIERFF